MKTNLILIFVGIAVLFTAATGVAETNEVAARWARVNTVGVHFTYAPDGQKWVNKKLSDIVSTNDIAKIILIDAVTSAPNEINLFNIYKTLESDATFYQRNDKYPAINNTYRAIIVTKDNHIFLIEIGKDPEGKRIARLASEKGIYGYFK